MVSLCLINFVFVYNALISMILFTAHVCDLKLNVGKFVALTLKAMIITMIIIFED